jgi:uncharacterized protein YjbJ (UPF0337 family)
LAGVKRFALAMKTIRTPISIAEVRGRSKQIKGKLREEVSKLRNNKTGQLKGKLEQTEGKARVRIARLVRMAKARL